VPAEIALSILAEIMAVTHGRPGSSLSIVSATP
jgi:xanthine/CO dehydrogenase XdhC/CoxF family maturation factor